MRRRNNNSEDKNPLLEGLGKAGREVFGGENKFFLGIDTIFKMGWGSANMVLSEGAEGKMLGTHIISGLAFLYIIGQDLYQSLDNKAINEGVEDFGQKIVEFLAKPNQLQQTKQNEDEQAVSSSNIELKEKSVVNPRFVELFAMINPVLKENGYKEINQEEQKLLVDLFTAKKESELKEIAQAIFESRKTIIAKSAPYVGASTAAATLGLGIAAPLVPAAAKLPVLSVAAGMAGTAAISSGLAKASVVNQKNFLTQLNSALLPKPSISPNPLDSSRVAASNREMEVV